MRLPTALREGRAEVDWRGLTGFRNIVVHDYLRIDLEEVWAIIQRDLALLSTVISEELAQLDVARHGLEGEGST